MHYTTRVHSHVHALGVFFLSLHLIFSVGPWNCSGDVIFLILILWKCEQCSINLYIIKDCHFQVISCYSILDSKWLMRTTNQDWFNQISKANQCNCAWIALLVNLPVIVDRYSIFQPLPWINVGLSCVILKIELSFLREYFRSLVIIYTCKKCMYPQIANISTLMYNYVNPSLNWLQTSY